MASSPTTSSANPPAQSEAAASTTDQPAPRTDAAAPDDERADDSDAASQSSKASSEQSLESGEASPVDPAAPEKSSASAPAKDDETAAAPPLPDEPLPTGANQDADDGWDYHWDEANQAYYFHNRITGQSTWENPRLANNNSSSSSSSSSATAANAAEPPKDERPPAGGYNPAIHGDYDPNAWYARSQDDAGAGGESSGLVDPEAAYAAIGSFNRFTGRWQKDEANPEQHNDENKSRRQMNAYFDVDAAANAHDGRSLKAERAGKKPSKAELKQFKEKRRAKKEEKRRAWLRD